MMDINTGIMLQVTARGAGVCFNPAVDNRRPTDVLSE